MKESDKRCKVIFNGDIVAGHDLPDVKQKLAALLKKDPSQIERLFSGREVVIAADVDAAAAEKFQRVFESAGALCRLVPIEAAAPQAAPGPSPEPATAHSSTRQDGGPMIVTNIESVPGKTIVEHYGLVSGSTIRAKHIGRDIMASLKNLVGGELKGYTELLRESRRQATERMIEQARQLGANAIINVRFSTSSVAQGAAELYAYGTAVAVR